MAAIQSVNNSFFVNIKNSEVLSKEAEAELFLKYKETGDMKHRDKIVLANSRFVIKVALEYKNSGVDIHDLFSEGIYGLIHAIKYFELESDVKFFSYAVYWVKHFMRKAINLSAAVKVPISTVKTIRQKLVDDTIDDYVEFDSKAQMALAAMRRPVSMGHQISEGSDITPEDILEDDRHDSVEKSHYAKVLSEELVRLINNSLPSLKADIILKTYGLGKFEVEQTLRDISHGSRYSHERIRQLRKEALNELKNSPHMQDYNNKFNEYTRMK